MPWWLGALLANACVVVIETLNRQGGYGGFLPTLLRTAPFVVLLQYGLYVCWSRAPHVMMAWAMFSVCNSIFRVGAVAWWYRDKLSWLHLLGVGVMMLGAYLIKRA